MAKRNLGRKRSDIAGSQNASLPSVPKLNSQKFTGNNAEQFAKLEAAINEKLASTTEFTHGLTSKNTDALMERIHAALETLAESTDVDTTSGNISLSDVDKIKTEIFKYINDSNIQLSDSLKEYTQSLISQVVNNASAQTIQPSSESDQKTLATEICKQLSDIFKTDASTATTDPNKNVLTDIANQAETVSDIVDTQTDVKNVQVSTSKDELMSYVSKQFSQLNMNIENFGKSFKNSPLFGFKNPFSEVVSKLNPFIMIENTLGKVSNSISSAITSIGSGLKTALFSPFKLLGESLSALNPLKFFKRKKKRGPNDTKEMLKLLKKMDKSFQKMELVFSDFIGYLVKHAKTFFSKIKSVFVKFWWEVLLETLVPTLLLIGGAIYLLADPLMKIFTPILDTIRSIVNSVIDFLKPIRDVILNALSPMLTAVGQTLSLLFKGIGTVAESLGKALGKLVIGVADFMVVVFLPFMKTIMIPLISEIGTVLKIFFKSIQPWIKPLVNTLMPILIKIIDILGKIVIEIGEILIDIARIIHAPIKMIADFFEGIGVRAKEIGEKASEAMSISMDIILEVLKLIRDNIGNLFDLIRLYVVAPLTAIRQKLDAKITLLRDKLSKFYIPTIEIGDDPSWHSPSSWFKIGKIYPFDGFKVTEDQLASAKATSEKPIGDLIKDEMSKMQVKIDADRKAKELENMNKQLQLTNMQKLLDNVNIIQTIYEMVKDIHNDMFGEAVPKTEISEQAVSRNFDTLQKINTQYAKSSESFIDSMNSESTQTNNAKEHVSLSTVFSYLKEHLAPMSDELQSISEKLDMPNVIPMPMPSQPTNLAAMEDM